MAQADLFERLAPAYEMLASPARIAAEADALEANLRAVGAVTVLDAGCAAGFHALELARRGFRVTGLDLSASMIREARARARAAAVPVRFVRCDLAEADRALARPVDAIVCLGNTLASVKTRAARARAFGAFRRCLRPGGLMVLQLRDLAAIRRTGHVFPTRGHRRGPEEWILLRRQDPAGGGIRFTTTLLYRPRASAPWEARSAESTLAIEPPAYWRRAIGRAGFTRVRLAGDLRGTPRRARGGADLVVFARRG